MLRFSRVALRLIYLDALRVLGIIFMGGTLLMQEQGRKTNSWAHISASSTSPSRAQARAQAGPKLGPSQKFGIPKNQKKNLKIQIRVAQNVGKVWIGRTKILLAPFGAFWAYFLRGTETYKKCQNFALLGFDVVQ